MHHRVRSHAVMLVAVAFAATLGLALPARASAHVPTLEPRTHGGIIEIDAPDASAAIYGTLETPGETDTYAFTPDTDIATTVEVLMPASTQGSYILRIEWEDGEAVPSGSYPEEPFFEPFSLQRFKVGGRIPDFTFESGMRYLVSVERDKIERGDDSYVLVFGGAERFSAADTVETLWEVPRIWFGFYGGWTNRVVFLPIFALGIVVVAWAIWIRRRRHRQHEHTDTGASL